MEPTTLVDPYLITTEFPGDWSIEYPEHWIEDDSGPACICEQGFLPLPDGGAIECHVCGMREH